MVVRGQQLMILKVYVKLCPRCDSHVVTCCCFVFLDCHKRLLVSSGTDPCVSPAALWPPQKHTDTKLCIVGMNQNTLPVNQGCDWHVGRFLLLL